MYYYGGQCSYGGGYGAPYAYGGAPYGVGVGGYGGGGLWIAVLLVVLLLFWFCGFGDRRDCCGRGR